MKSRASAEVPQTYILLFGQQPIYLRLSIKDMKFILKIIVIIRVKNEDCPGYARTHQSVIIRILKTPKGPQQ